MVIIIRARSLRIELGPDLLQQVSQAIGRSRGLLRPVLRIHDVLTQPPYHVTSLGSTQSLPARGNEVSAATKQTRWPFKHSCADAPSRRATLPVTSSYRSLRFPVHRLADSSAMVVRRVVAFEMSRVKS